jgi:hypothetical protein
MSFARICMLHVSRLSCLRKTGVQIADKTTTLLSKMASEAKGWILDSRGPVFTHEVPGCTFETEIAPSLSHCIRRRNRAA